MPAGRPRKEINQKQFEQLCSMMCTLTEIAGFFNCSEDTIERWCKRTYKLKFAEAFQKYSASGKISLRRSQMKLAETNATMAIWLGKQWLHQRDKPYDPDAADNSGRQQFLEATDRQYTRDYIADLFGYAPESFSTESSEGGDNNDEA